MFSQTHGSVFLYISVSWAEAMLFVLHAMWDAHGYREGALQSRPSLSLYMIWSERQERLNTFFQLDNELFSAVIGWIGAGKQMILKAEQQF